MLADRFERASHKPDAYFTLSLVLGWASPEASRISRWPTSGPSSPWFRASLRRAITVAYTGTVVDATEGGGRVLFIDSGTLSSRLLFEDEAADVLHGEAMKSSTHK